MFNPYFSKLAGRFATLSPAGRARARNAAQLDDDHLLSQFSLLDHLFIIRALMLRNLRTKHSESRFGFLVEFIQPVFIIGIHYYGFTIMQRYMPARIPVELFVLGGFTTWFALSHTVRGKHGRPGRIPMLNPRITPMHSILAGALWECISNIWICFAGLILFMILGFKDPLPNIPLSIAVYFVASAVGLGLRLIFDAIGEVFSMMHTLKVSLMWMVFFTGGIYFSAYRLNNPLGGLALYNPALHLLEYQRHALFAGYPVATVSMTYPTFCAMGLILTGLILKRWIELWHHD